MIITLFSYEAYFLRVPENPENKPTAYPGSLIQEHIPINKPFPGTLLRTYLQIDCPGEETFVALKDASLLIIGSASEFSSHALLGTRINEDKMKRLAVVAFYSWQQCLTDQLINIL